MTLHVTRDSSPTNANICIMEYVAGQVEKNVAGQVEKTSLLIGSEFYKSQVFYTNVTDNWQSVLV